MNTALLNGRQVSSFDIKAYPALNQAWNDLDRVGKPAIMTFGDAGVTGLPATAKGVVFLDVHQGHEGLQSVNPNHVFDDTDLDRLLAHVINREWTRDEHEPRRGIMLMGPSGTGKTTFLEQRHAQRGIPLYSITGSPDLMAADLIQTREVVQGTTFWADGVLLKAMREGVPLLINEGDVMSPAQWVRLNEFVEKGRAVLPESGEVVVAKRGFMMHVTCNSSFTEDRRGGYSGTRSQNASVMARFYLYQMNHASAQAESSFLLSQYPALKADLTDRMAAFAESTRKASSGALSGTTLEIDLSRRHLRAWAEMMLAFAYLQNQKIDVAQYTLRFVYTEGMAPEQVQAVHHLLDLAFNNSQTP